MLATMQKRREMNTLRALITFRLRMGLIWVREDTYAECNRYLTSRTYGLKVLANIGRHPLRVSDLDTWWRTDFPHY